MKGPHSHLVKVQLVWYDHALLEGSTVVEAANVNAAVEATLQLLREIPAPVIVDRAGALSSAPWAPGEQRSIERVTITAPTGRRGSSAVLTWTGSHGTGTLRPLHEDWPTGLRNVLAFHVGRPSPPLAALLDRIGRGAYHKIPFRLFGMLAKLTITPAARPR